jgi:hypothetical protein
LERHLIQVAGIVFCIGLVVGGLASNRVTALHYKNQILQAEHDAKVQTTALGENATLLRKARDAEKDRISARLADAIAGLRNRPERLPDTAAAACAGASGRELSGPDAEFLERLAAEADRLRAALAEQQAWIEKVTR